MVYRCVFFILCVQLIACQSTPEVAALSEKNADLQAQLASARQQISSFEAEQRIMAADNTELKRINAILDSEKTNRQEESAQLRLNVREFAQAQIDALKEFLVQSNLLDYIGEALLDRNHIDSAAGVLVDIANPIPRKGSMIGVNGHFAQATRFSVSILRPITDRYVVIWQSELVEFDGEGYQRQRFPVSVGVEKGDILAYDFPNAIGVKYDKGTGGTLVSPRSFVLGAAVDAGALQYAEEKRAYSLGVFAILDSVE